MFTLQRLVLRCAPALPRQKKGRSLKRVSFGIRHRTRNTSWSRTFPWARCTQLRGSGSDIGLLTARRGKASLMPAGSGGGRGGAEVFAAGRCRTSGLLVQLISSRGGMHWCLGHSQAESGGVSWGRSGIFHTTLFLYWPVTYTPTTTSIHNDKKTKRKTPTPHKSHTHIL